VVELLSVHLAQRVAADPEWLIFTGDKGAPLRRSNFNRTARWPERVTAVGAPGLHFHDLRHTGNLLAAASGASLRDLMSRMGHDSMRAALIYQHTTQTVVTHHPAAAPSGGAWDENWSRVRASFLLGLWLVSVVVRGELLGDRFQVAAADVGVLGDVFGGDEELAGGAEFLRVLDGLAVPGCRAGCISWEV